MKLLGVFFLPSHYALVSVCLSRRLSLCLSVCPSVCLSVRPPVCLSVCLSVFHDKLLRRVQTNQPPNGTDFPHKSNIFSERQGRIDQVCSVSSYK